jgi:hypothetical protein
VRKFGGTAESMLFGSHISDDHAVMRPGHDFEEEEEEGTYCICQANSRSYMTFIIPTHLS